MATRRNQPVQPEVLSEATRPPPVGRSPDGGPTRVTLTRSGTEPTSDQAFWAAIRGATDAIGFRPYAQFLDDVMCDRDRGAELVPRSRRILPFPGVDGYAFLKAATEVFLMSRCRILDANGQLNSFNLAEESARMNRSVSQSDIAADFSAYTGDDDITPYLEAIRQKLGEVPLRANGPNLGTACYGILRERLVNPCMLELIWSYWHEEGMLAQTMSAVSLRFQNRRTGAGDREPLANLMLDPLRPINDLLWGFIQDEQHRLSVLRRAYEYDHQYGITLDGKAVKQLRPADSRSKFLEAFHNLLQLCSTFYKQDDNTTVIADGFVVLNGLKEVHLLLTQGGHNQYGSLPWNARLEMMMTQWLLARPEMREFLAGRTMVAYAEPWMDRVDAMKSLMGWTDTTVTHFRDLGVFGEKILLSIRYGNWSRVFNRDQAANWARYWREEVQGYQHAYRAVTGVDLNNIDAAPDAMTRAEIAAPPSVHLRKRLAAQGRR